jgi:hypothetical protein
VFTRTPPSGHYGREDRPVAVDTREVRTMAQTKNGSTKKDSKKSTPTGPVDKKTARKTAKKALAKAEKSVSAAHAAVTSSSKKLRTEARALAAKTEKLAAKHEKATRKHEKAVRKLAAESARGARLTVPETTRPTSAPAATTPPQELPSTKRPPRSLATTRRDTSVTEKPSLTPPLPKPGPATPNLIELRRRAREQKIRGFSRLSKAELIAALDSAERA